MPTSDGSDNRFPTTNSAEAVAFLQDFDPDGRHNLVAIDPDSAYVTGRTFAPGAWTEIAAWVDANSTRNVYFSVNEPSDTAPDTKLKKHHIAALRAIPVDVDPRKGQDFAAERARLAELVGAVCSSHTAPTYVIDSGGGYQFFWRLAEKRPTSDAEWAEEQGRGLAAAIGEGDAIQNIDRIMRLPGTVNYPDERKRAKGRPVAPTSLVANSGRLYSRQQLETYAAPRKAERDGEDLDPDIEQVRKSIDMAEVLQGPSPALVERVTRHRALSPRLDNVLAGRPLPGDAQSGSDYRWALAEELCMLGGYTATEFAQVAVSLPQCNTDKDQAGGWPRAFARDWVRKGHTAAIEKWFAPIEDSPFDTPANSNTKSRRLKLIDLEAAANQALDEAAKPLIKGLLDQSAMTVLYGDSNVGKTFVALLLSFHIAEGRTFAGMKTSQFSVVYVAAEGGRGILKRAKALRDTFVPLNPTRLQIVREPIDLRASQEDLQAMLDAVSEVNEIAGTVGLIVIDTASRALAGGDENSSVDMGAFVRNLDALRARTNAHILIIHHCGKNKAAGARGHSLLRAAVDTEIEVEENVISVTKQRDLEKGWETGFRLKEVPLGIDADGDLVTSAIVELCTVAEARPQDEDKESDAPTLTKAQSRVLRAVEALCATQHDREEGAPLRVIAQATADGDRKPVPVETVRYTLAVLAGLGFVEKTGWGRWVPVSPGARDTADESPRADIFG